MYVLRTIFAAMVDTSKKELFCAKLPEQIVAFF